MRIGFLPPSDSQWMGGVNYFANLFSVIAQYGKGEIECVAFLPANVPPSIKAAYAKNAEVVECGIFRKWGVSWIAKHLLHRLGYSLWGRIMRKHRIDVVSHVANYTDFGVPVIGWIPDFQHMWLPDCFEEEEKIRRDREFKELCEKGAAVILSSHSAYEDCVRFLGKDSGNLHVIRFSTKAAQIQITEEELTAIRDRHSLPDKFFYLPNQFWRHKNHRVVWDAVRLLKERGTGICVVCTGLMRDLRNPEHVEKLKEYSRVHGLENAIRLLGLVDYKDVLGLMKQSVAVINPSLFEGWSSTVEECKTNKLPIVLSAIPVHKEQAPSRGFFFEPQSPEALADILEELWLHGVPEAQPDCSLEIDKAQEFYQSYASLLRSL